MQKRKNGIFTVEKTNETEEGFLNVTGYISEADKVMEYWDWYGVTREIIPLQELEKCKEQANGLIFTNSHPWDFVDANNATEYTKGFVTEVIGIESGKLKVNMKIIDSATINDIRSNRKKDFSIGYLCDLEEERGVTAGGENYDYKQINLHLNHVALVESGRAGEEVGVISYNEKNKDVSFQKGLYKKNSFEGGIMKVKYNGKEMDASELLAEISVRDNELSLKKNESDTKDGRIAALEAEKKDLEEKVNGIDSKIENAVNAKLNAMQEVSKFLPDEKQEDLMKLNSIDLKKKVINAAFEGMDLEGKSEAYIDGLYQGATGKLNSANAEATPAGEGESSEKLNGVEYLAKINRERGGK